MKKQHRRYPRRSARPSRVPWAVSFARGVVLAACALVPLALLGAGLLTLSESSVLYVRHVDVLGNERLDRDEILTAAGLDRPTRVLQVVPTEVEQQLEAHPWIVDATVVATLRGLVHIEVVEARPAVVAASPDGVRLVDDGGRPIRAVTPEDLVDFPLVAGLPYAADTGTFDAAVVQAALAISDAVALRDELPAVRELQYEAVYGWRVILADGAEVALGNDRMDVRIGRLADVYRTLGQQGLAAQRVAVDTEQLRHVAVALRPQVQEGP